MKKNLIIIVIILILAGGLYYYGSVPKKAQAPVSNNQPSSQQAGGNQEADKATATAESQNQSASGTPPTIPGKGQGTFSAGEEQATGPDIQVFEIDYDGAKFVPAAVNIKVNDYVIFKNTSSVDFWPASNPHPLHTDYPGFDAKRAIAPGGRYQFQFAKAGNWGFHNHLTPEVGGTVNVSK